MRELGGERSLQDKAGGTVSKNKGYYREVGAEGGLSHRVGTSCLNSVKVGCALQNAVDNGFFIRGLRKCMNFPFCPKRS
jgi:hypothetical protein